MSLNQGRIRSIYRTFCLPSKGDGSHSSLPAALTARKGRPCSCFLYYSVLFIVILSLYECASFRKAGAKVGTFLTPTKYFTTFFANYCKNIAKHGSKGGKQGGKRGNTELYLIYIIHRTPKLWTTMKSSQSPINYQNSDRFAVTQALFTEMPSITIGNIEVFFR